MANILQMASKLANINQYSDDTNTNSIPTLESSNTILTQIGFPDSPSSIDWSGLTDAITAYNDSDKNKSQLTSSPQTEAQKDISCSRENVDDSFDFYTKGFSNSPLASPGLANVIENIKKDNNVSRSSSSISSDITCDISFRNDVSTSEELHNNISFESISHSPQQCSFQSSDSGVFSSAEDSYLLSHKNLDRAKTDSTCAADESTRQESHKRPDISFVEMIAQCMLASRNDKVRLSDIYDFILTTYPYFENAPAAWRISVRHHLSTCDSFIKVGRVPLSRGFFWAIHASCKEDFRNGIFDRKLIRKRLGNLKPKKKANGATQNVTEKAAVQSTRNIQMLCENQHTDAGIVDSVYNRLNRLSSEQVKSCTSLNAYPAHNYYSYVSTNNLHGISNNSTGHYHVPNSLSYYGNIPNYYYNYDNYYASRYLQQPAYNSAHQYVSLPYGQHAFNSKANHQSSSRYLPY